MIRTGVAMALAWGLAGPARAATVGIELKAYPAQTMLGRLFTLEAQVKNVGATNVNDPSWSLVAEPMGGAATLSKTDSSVINPLPAGGQSAVRYTFLATKAGAVRFTFTLAGTEAGTGAAVRVASPPLVIGIGDESANRPAEGTFQIRHNVIRVNREDWFPPHEMAYLVVTGPPGGEVSFTVYGPSGRRIDKVSHETNFAVGQAVWTIGSDGRLTVPFDGVIRKSPLSTGPYWMVASGAVTGKRPFVVIKQ